MFILFYSCIDLWKEMTCVQCLSQALLIYEPVQSLEKKAISY